MTASGLTVALACASLAGGCGDGGAGAAPDGAQLIVGGAVDLAGNDGATCSHQPNEDGKPPRERWCAFVRGHAKGQSTELWVINLDRARAGDAVCDGVSPHCLRLTTTLWTGEPPFAPGHPYIHGFWGDTLFFYSDSLTGNTDLAFEGPIYAWRPGMSQARVVSTAKGYYCFGHERTAAAVCLANQSSSSGVLEFDLLGGPIEGGPVGPLPIIERVRPLDAKGQPAWAASFSPTGQYFAFSTSAAPAPGAPPGPATQTLHIIPTAQLGALAPRAVLPEVERWSFTPDEKKVLFLRDLRTDGIGVRTGKLMMADFPTPGAPTLLAEDVGHYQIYGDTGAPPRALGIYRQPFNSGELSTFLLMRDLARPQEVITVGDKISDALVSPDLRYSFFQSETDKGDTVSLIARNDGSGKCLLNQNAGQGAYYVRFLPEMGRVLWAEDAAGGAGAGGGIEGWLGDPNDCRGMQRFSTRLGYFQPAGRGLLWGDVDAANISMELRYSPFAANALALDKTKTFAKRAGLVTVLVDKKYMVFSVADGPNTDPGIYVYGPLP